VPDVEWWDRGLLAHGSYDDDVAGEVVELKDNKVGAAVVQHCTGLEGGAGAFLHLMRI
jgi:hypothetical protein